MTRSKLIVNPVLHITVMSCKPGLGCSEQVKVYLVQVLDHLGFTKRGEWGRVKEEGWGREKKTHSPTTPLFIVLHSPQPSNVS